MRLRDFSQSGYNTLALKLFEFKSGNSICLKFSEKNKISVNLQIETGACNSV